MPFPAPQAGILSCHLPAARATHSCRRRGLQGDPILEPRGGTVQILLGGEWRDGFLDEHRSPDQVRVQVCALRNLERVEGLYFVRGSSARMVWNYVREIGPRDVARKVLSRRSERGRNDKRFSCGLGRVVEAPVQGDLAAGDRVVFLAPVGPPCAERLVLPAALVQRSEDAGFPTPPEDELWYVESMPELEEEERFLRPLRGWSPWAGRPLPMVVAEMALKGAAELLRDTDWSTRRTLPLSHETGIREASREVRAPASDGRARAVLFGYGNYAKTTVLPNVGAALRVDRIHEIDPTQIPSGDGRAWDTAGWASPADAGADAFLIAGYHHTHAALACQALRAGAAAVVEKPLATTSGDLSRLLATLEETGGRLFGCFQRRYHPFNEMAREDLGVERGEPISYHAIVYEVPLPEHHWYRWPNSRTRLISNGCHWLDHFLYLNDWAEVASYDLFEAPDGTTTCAVSLVNGAFMSMVLTDVGSERIGMQDYVELRAKGTTVKITNASRYEAESGTRTLRRKRINKLQAYRAMYATIGRRILAGEAGDSVESVRTSGRLVLDLEKALCDRREATELSEHLLPGIDIQVSRREPAHARLASPARGREWIAAA
jgi:predicted dehydrogenase